MLINTEASLKSYLKDRRVSDLKLSQTQVADIAGVKQNTVSQAELNPMKMNFGTLWEMCFALGLEIHLVPKVDDPDDFG